MVHQFVGTSAHGAVVVAGGMMPGQQMPPYQQYMAQPTVPEPETPDVFSGYDRNSSLACSHVFVYMRCMLMAGCDVTNVRILI